MLLNEPFKDLNAEYFARRTDYVAAISSPDYVNVTREDHPAPGDGGQRASYVNMDPQQQTAAYRASRAGEWRGRSVGGRRSVVSGRVIQDLQVWQVIQTGQVRRVSRGVSGNQYSHDASAGQITLG